MVGGRSTHPRDRTASGAPRSVPQDAGVPHPVPAILRHTENDVATPASIHQAYADTRLPARSARPNGGNQTSTRTSPDDPHLSV